MSKNVAYVREHRVAALLNDMVVHLLAAKPGDPTGSLITYLEKRLDAEGGAPTPAAPKPAVVPAPPPADKKDGKRPTPSHQASEPANTTVDSPASVKSPQRGLPPGLASRPGTADDMELMASRSTWLDVDVLSPKSQPKLDDIGRILEDLAASEDALSALIAQAIVDPSIDIDTKAALSSGASAAAEMKKYVVRAGRTHTEIGVALDRVRSTLTDKEFYASTGFRLIHQLEVQEREARKVMHQLVGDTSKLSQEDRALLQRAQGAHEELLGLVGAIEEKQLEIAVKANGGAVNESVVHYFDGLSTHITETYMALRNNAAVMEEKVPGAVVHHGVRTLGALPVDRQVDVLAEEVRKQQAIFDRAMALLENGGDADVTAAVNEALASSEQMQQLANMVSHNNSALSTRAPETYNDTRAAIIALNNEIAGKLLLFHQTHHAAVSRVARAAVTHCSDAFAKDAAEVKALLAKSDAPEAKQALANEESLERMLSDIAAAQRTITRHAVSH